MNKFSYFRFGDVGEALQNYIFEEGENGIFSILTGSIFVLEFDTVDRLASAMLTRPQDLNPECNLLKRRLGACTEDVLLDLAIDFAI